MEENEYNRIIENIDKEKLYEKREGLLYRIKGEKGLRVVRKYEFEGLMYMMHDNELSGHFGIEATIERIKEKYYWKNMRKDIEQYVKSCWECQMRGKPQGENRLQPIRVGEPFEIIGIDIVGPLKETMRRNKYIIVAIDYFTKWPESTAVKEATAQEVVEFIWKDIICRHGCPKKIISDRGTHFNNQLMEDLMKRMGINHRLSTPYHPETNGLVERFNKTLCQALAKLGEDDWDLHIPSVLYAYRTKRNKSTKMKPFYIVYGRQDRNTLEKESDEMTMIKRIERIIEKLPIIRERVRGNIKEAQDKQKLYHDKKTKEKQVFEIGEKVLVYQAWRDKQWTGKLQEKFKGPYLIHEKLSNGVYKLKELNGKILKTPQNGKWIKKFHSREGFDPRIVIREKEEFDKRKLRFD